MPDVILALCLTNLQTISSWPCPPGSALPRLALLMFLAFTAFALVFCLQEKPVKNRKFVMTGKKGVLAGVLLFWSIISLGTVTQFIYSNF